MKFKTAWWLARLACLLSLCFAIWATNSTLALPWILFVVCIVTALILGISARCPSCDKTVVSRGIVPPHFCPHCGESLD